MARGYDFDYDPHEDEIAEARLDARFERTRRLAFQLHPDPRDPDYPGADNTTEEEANEAQ